MQRNQHSLVKIGLERGYLDAASTAGLLEEAHRLGCSADRLLVEREILSPRRIKRLRNHHRYRAMRKVDKVYGALAVRRRIVTRRQVIAALDHQKRHFESHRECIRVGSQLIDGGLLTVEEDRELRASVTGTELPPEVQGEASSAATIALDEGSRHSLFTARPSTSYAKIEEAVRRVDSLREIQEDLSTSDNIGVGDSDTPQRARCDSANEIENALTVLARRRLGASYAHEPLRPDPPKRKKRKTKKKSTGLMRIFRIGA